MEEEIKDALAELFDEGLISLRASDEGHIYYALSPEYRAHRTETKRQQAQWTNILTQLGL